jgi:hypothetical protein
MAARRNLHGSSRPAWPLDPGREYRLNANVRRGACNDRESSGYAALYDRAAAIVRARTAEIDAGLELHTWIASHAWGEVEFRGGRRMAFATVTAGLLLPRPGDARPTGRSAPAADALSAPGGATFEELAALHAAGETKRLDEIYTDFDVRDPEEPGPAIALFSYGEYGPAREGIDFRPFVERAEHRARFHRDLLKAPTDHPAWSVVRREWMHVTSPDLAVIHIYFRE